MGGRGKIEWKSFYAVKDENCCPYDASILVALSGCAIPETRQVNPPSNPGETDSSAGLVEPVPHLFVRSLQQSWRWLPLTLSIPVVRPPCSPCGRLNLALDCLQPSLRPTWPFYVALVKIPNSFITLIPYGPATNELIEEFRLPEFFYLRFKLIKMICCVEMFIALHFSLSWCLRVMVRGLWGW